MRLEHFFIKILDSSFTSTDNSINPRICPNFTTNLLNLPGYNLFIDRKI